MNRAESKINVFYWENRIHNLIVAVYFQLPQYMGAANSMVYAIKLKITAPAIMDKPLFEPAQY